MKNKILSSLFLLSLISSTLQAAYIPAATKQDDAAFTPATDNVDVFGAEFDNVGTDSVDEGDAGALRMSANRNLYVQLRDSTNERSAVVDANGYLTTNINGTVTISDGAGALNVIVDSGSLTADTELPSAATIAADTVTPTVPGVASYQFIKTPSANTWDRQYSVVAGQDTTGTGISAVGIQAQLDDVATTSVTENQFANARLSSRRALLVEGVASGTAIPISAASASIASGAIASGAVSSGAIASGAFASGSISAGAIATGATSIAANEDDASANLDTGVKILAIQQSTPADTGGTNGDYTALQMSGGKLWTNASVSSGGIASGAIASGAVASGAFASGSIASGAIASGAIASGALASGSIAAGAIANGATSIADNEDVASADADRLVKVAAIRDDTLNARSGTEGDYEQFHLDANGALWVDFNINGTAAVTGSGTATGALRVELANNGTGLLTANPATAANWGIYVEDAAETTSGNLMMAGTVRRDTAASSAGTTGDNATLNTDATGRIWINTAVVEDAAHSAGETLSGIGARRIDPLANSAGSDADWGTVNQSAEGALYVVGSPTTASGCSVFMATSADGSTALTNSAQAIKASAGCLYGYYIYNPNSSATYVHLYNTAAASVTVGTTNPLITLDIPATSAANVTFPYGITFSNAGWSCSATTTGGGNSAPSTALEAVFYYK